MINKINNITSTSLARFMPIVTLAVIATASMVVTAAPKMQDDTSSATSAAPLEDEKQDAAVQSRGPLLREGSALVSAIGMMKFDEARRRWIFLAQAREREAQPSELVLLPCLLLQEMRDIENASSGHDVQFRITGEVFVFEEENYLLPTFAPQLVGSRGPVQTEPADDPPADEDASTESEGEADDDIAAIQKRLNDSIGDVARSSAPDRGVRDTMSPAGFGDGEMIWKEGSRIVDRAGRLTRDASGAWVFVLDADSQSQADPPLIILPCMLLENMASYAKARLNNGPALMSGRVHLYDRRAYLLPDNYRIPRFRTRINR